MDLNKLINLAKNNDLKAKNNLYQKYYYLIVNITSKFYNYFNEKNGYFKDILQEAIYAFFKAIENFDTNSNTNFTSYVYITIKNYLLNYIKKNEKIRQNLNNNLNYKLIDDVISEELSEEDLIFLEELYKKIENIFLYEFTNLEREVFLYYLDNFSYSEISEMLNKEKKTIDNALYRAKNKLISKLNSTEKNFLLNQKGTILALKDILEKIKNKD